MIVLDTNVVSEAMKPEPHLAVRTWLNDQAAETLYLGFYAQTGGNFRQLINRQFQPRWHPSQSGAACLGMHSGVGRTTPGSAACGIPAAPEITLQNSTFGGKSANQGSKSRVFTRFKGCSTG